MSASFRTCPLPTGENVAYISKPDVAFLYREVYEKQSYLQHGVTIAPGNTVLDVGANIGMFAAFAAQRVGILGHVIAVEPIPLTCDVLTYNMGTTLREGAGRDLLRKSVSYSESVNGPRFYCCQKVMHVSPSSTKELEMG